MRLLLTNIKTEVSRAVISSRACCHPAIPVSVTRSNYKLREKSDRAPVIDPATIEHLERISLVDFANVAGVRRLEEAVKLAEIVTRVDTTGVQPLYTVLEEETLRLRDDVVELPNNRRELMAMASLSEEDYFVAPQGNVPLSYHNKYSEESQS